MIRSIFAILVAAIPVVSGGSHAPADGRYRSPAALTGDAEDRYVYVAETAGSCVAVVDVSAGKVIREVGVPKPPSGLALDGGRIKTNAEGKTTLANVWAGGDCVHGSDDLTVVAVEDGKIAAESIHAALSA